MTALPLVFEAPRRGMPPRHLADLDREERRAVVTELGEPAFRADQLARHYFTRLSTDPAAMTDLPAARRDQLVAALLPELAIPVRHICCDSGTTRKTLWRAVDGTLTESVLMRYPDRATVCVSSQAGCGMACPFCATGQAGLTRNLSTSEIVDQVRAAAAAMRDGDLTGGPGRLSNVVFMGMGEPLQNLDAVLAACDELHDPAGLGISARRIAISTVGWVPGIARLADHPLPVRLAVSLHATEDALRNQLVPVNRRWPLAQLLPARLLQPCRRSNRRCLLLAVGDGRGSYRRPGRRSEAGDPEPPPDRAHPAESAACASNERGARSNCAGRPDHAGARVAVHQRHSERAGFGNPEGKPEIARLESLFRQSDDAAGRNQ